MYYTKQRLSWKTDFLRLHWKSAFYNQPGFSGSFYWKRYVHIHITCRSILSSVLTQRSKFFIILFVYLSILERQYDTLIIFNVISIYRGTFINSHLSTTTSLKITTFLIVQSTFLLYIKPLYNIYLPTTATFSKGYFAKAQEPASQSVYLQYEELAV